MKNIILIGLPGAGKSTIGVLLAKTLGMRFIDTDIAIQERMGRLLQDIIDTDGSDAFIKTEEETILALNPSRAVVATGGSAVFGRLAMEFLKNKGSIVYLQISYEEMERRLNNITTRGIVLFSGQSLKDMYNQRIPLYKKYADITIDCSTGNVEGIVRQIIEDLRLPRR